MGQEKGFFMVMMRYGFDISRMGRFHCVHTHGRIAPFLRH